MHQWGTEVARLTVLLTGNFMPPASNMHDTANQEHILAAPTPCDGKFQVGVLDVQDQWGIKLDNMEKQHIALILTVDVGLMVVIQVVLFRLM
jgi:hypothetical protein